MNIKDALITASGKPASLAATSTEAQSIPREYYSASTNSRPIGPSLTASGTVSTFRHWLLVGSIFFLLLVWAFTSGWLVAKYQDTKPALPNDGLFDPRPLPAAPSRPR